MCNICGKGFVDKGHLKSHIKSVHEGIKPFKCPHCERRCAKKSNIVVHAKNAHQKTILKSEIIKIEGDEKYVAPIDEEKPFKCELCGMGFSTKRNVFRHEAKKHKIGSYECTLCNEKFTLKRHLIDHCAKFHEGRAI